MGAYMRIFFVAFLFLAGCAQTAGDTYVLDEATIEEGLKTGQLIMEDKQSNPDYVVGATPAFEEMPDKENDSEGLDQEMKRHPGRQN